MPRKRSPVFQKVTNLLKLSIFIAKMREFNKPIIPKLIFLKKKSTRLSKFKLLNNGYIQAYQFSPSNTPLIHYYQRKPLKKRKNRDMCSVLFFGRCLGNIRDEKCPLENLAGIEDEEVLTREVSEWSDSGGEEEDSVDEKAERFIERFYEEMRRQRQESALQLC